MTMRDCRLRWLLTGLVALLALCAGGVARSADKPGGLPETEAQFREVYPPALERLERQFASFEAEAEFETSYAEWPVPRYQRQTVYADLDKQSYQLMEVEIEGSKTDASGRMPQPGARRVTSSSPGGGFNLHAEPRHQQFSLASVGESQRDQLAIDLKTRWSKSHFVCAFYAENLSMHELLREPAFRIRSVRPDENQGRVHLVFEHDGRRPYCGWRELHLEFAPELGWPIVATRTVSSFVEGDPRAQEYARYEQQRTCTYAQRAGMLVPQEIARRVFDQPREQGRPVRESGHERVTFTRFERRPVASEQFRPSAYGFPDSVLNAASTRDGANRLGSLWLLLLGMLLAAAIAFALVKRRAAGGGPPHPPM